VVMLLETQQHGQQIACDMRDHRPGDRRRRHPEIRKAFTSQVDVTGPGGPAAGPRSRKRSYALARSGLTSGERPLG
jgi:hypothetical protein